MYTLHKHFFFIVTRTVCSVSMCTAWATSFLFQWILLKRHEGSLWLRNHRHLLFIVQCVPVVGAAVHFGRGVGDDAISWRIEKPTSLLWHQQGRGILSTAAFLHIVHLHQAGKNKGTGSANTSKQKAQTTPQLIFWLWAQVLPFSFTYV